MPMVRVSTRLEFPRRSNSRLINIAFQSPHQTSVLPGICDKFLRLPALRKGRPRASYNGTSSQELSPLNDKAEDCEDVNPILV
jgi:hypothetical protein